MLRDCLVCGCRDRRLQCKLLVEKDLTFDQALGIAKALETAEKETKDFQESSSTVPVHTVCQERRHLQRRAPNQPVAKPQVPECYRCGGKHRAIECKFRETECLVCKKKGHIVRACRSKQRPQIRTHQFLTSITDQAETDEYSLYHTHGQGNTYPILVDLRLNVKDISMELDTGATLSLVSEKTYHSLFSPDTAPQLKAFSAELKTYTGEVLNILGTITVTVS